MAMALLLASTMVNAQTTIPAVQPSTNTTSGGTLNSEPVPGVKVDVPIRPDEKVKIDEQTGEVISVKKRPEGDTTTLKAANGNGNFLISEEEAEKRAKQEKMEAQKGQKAGKKKNMPK